jgi:DNA-binding LacI/PurR family transcriptional regulator
MQVLSEPKQASQTHSFGELTGVSVQKTVSRVLNDGNDLAAATRERMLQSTEIPSAT